MHELISRIKYKFNPKIPGVGKVRFGDLRRVRAIGRNFGLGRGVPIDRYYIENFLARHSDDIKGRVLEIQDNEYTKQFGGQQVKQSDVLDIDKDNHRANIVADITKAENMPADFYDCIILTQVLSYLCNVKDGLNTVYRILKPGGVLLLTVPGISQTGGGAGHSFFTEVSTKNLIESIFFQQEINMESHGNVLVAISFLHGLTIGELTPKELDFKDRDYQVVVTARVVKKG